jgi:hypothetical protein
MFSRIDNSDRAKRGTEPTSATTVQIDSSSPYVIGIDFGTQALVYTSI